MSFIKFNGKMFKIDKQSTEPDEEFEFRKYWVLSCKPKTVEELNKAITSSYVARNIKFLKCSYEADLMNKIMKQIKIINS